MSRMKYTKRARQYDLALLYVFLIIGVVSLLTVTTAWDYFKSSRFPQYAYKVDIVEKRRAGVRSPRYYLKAYAPKGINCEFVTMRHYAFVFEKDAKIGVASEIDVQIPLDATCEEGVIKAAKVHKSLLEKFIVVGSIAVTTILWSLFIWVLVRRRKAISAPQQQKSLGPKGTMILIISLFSALFLMSLLLLLSYS